MTKLVQDKPPNKKAKNSAQHREIFKPLARKGNAPKLYFIGIKGTGMCALAQLLTQLDYRISGSDVEEHFYTDELLQASGISYQKGFCATNLPTDCDLIIYSAAYDHSNPEYAAAEKLLLPMLSYPEALAAFSSFYKNCIAVAGVHGKTTSTLLMSSLMQSLRLQGSALAGASAPHLAGNAFLVQGTKFLAIETCEYRNHFFYFQPSVVLLTSLEWDHQDFFSSYTIMQESFRSFIEQDSVETVVYCADDPGVRELIGQIQNKAQRQADAIQADAIQADAIQADAIQADVIQADAIQAKPIFIPYGLKTPDVAQAEQGSETCSNFRLKSIEVREGESIMRLQAFPEKPLSLKVPGAHLALNALGGLAALFQVLKQEGHYQDFAEFFSKNYDMICSGLRNFTGASRRSELLGEIAWQANAPENRPKNEKSASASISSTGSSSASVSKSVLVLDDYAHHPTAVAKTLAGLKKFYPKRRLVLDFMSHTYTRTKTLHREFSQCFQLADQLILHNIYGSAREQKQGDYNGRVLWQAVNASRYQHGLAPAYYFEQPLDALPELANILKAGDLFVTMGAGSNRELALALLKGAEEQGQLVSQSVPISVPISKTSTENAHKFGDKSACTFPSKVQAKGMKLL